MLRELKQGASSMMPQGCGHRASESFAMTRCGCASIAREQGGGADGTCLRASTLNREESLSDNVEGGVQGGKPTNQV
jgi:hypothetical protein